MKKEDFSAVLLLVGAGLMVFALWQFDWRLGVATLGFLLAETARRNL